MISWWSFSRWSRYLLCGLNSAFSPPTYDELTETHSIIDRIEQLVKDVKDFMAYDIEKKMDDIFLELCGDFPGAIANRILYTVSPYNKPSYIPPTSLRSFSYTRLSDNDANPFDTSIESFYVDR